MTALARYLQRTTKRNVILTGRLEWARPRLSKAGQRITTGQVPDFLRSPHFACADCDGGSSPARTTARRHGQRLQRIIEAAVADPNLVLFLDEIHLTMGTGGACGRDERGGHP